MRDRTKQINLDFTKYPEALEVYNRIPHNKTGFVAEAIIEKDSRDSKGKGITREEYERIVIRISAISGFIEQLHDRIKALEERKGKK